MILIYPPKTKESPNLLEFDTSPPASESVSMVIHAALLRCA